MVILYTREIFSLCHCETDLGSEDSLIARVMFTCSPGKPSILGKWALNQ